MISIAPLLLVALAPLQSPRQTPTVPRLAAQSASVPATGFAYPQWVLDEAVAREFTEFVFNTNYRTEMGGTDWYGAPDGGCRTLRYAGGGTVCVRLQGGI